MTSTPPTKSLPKRNALQRDGDADGSVQAGLGRWDLPLWLCRAGGVGGRLGSNPSCDLDLLGDLGQMS